ncbi:TetR/AcrR family transcriptional regulator [Cryobacterium algoricola]|uniref:TetR/AcrR family transcriptional regulator n=1 Tax=Cryobacterium algoricola TaxID=1259183 RepID=UPI001F53F790|nr:TetR/AcrR family transcriptional regulator [Cryobacterium algoricola]
MAKTQLDPAVENPAVENPAEETEPVKLGRRRDHTRDPDILAAAVDVLAECGYDGMTIDMVATRAKAGKATLYRRWPSKGELVIDAVACMKNADLNLSQLPDTGTLRGDLIAMIKPHSIEDGEKKLRVIAGLMSLLAHSPELAETARVSVVEPRVTAHRFLLRRAVERGEISPSCDIDNLSTVTTAMASMRILFESKTIDREFLISLIDGVILPAAGLSPGTGTGPVAEPPAPAETAVTAR